jgi:MoaA/NifB/PqqE/SkfB family radical SAM enzyme
VASSLARLEEGLAALRSAARPGRPRGGRRQPPERPIGIKLELTHRCNLRCGFCYTDSPRRTLERTPDLPDADWRRIVDEAIELGVIEAVVTGGEPLLRRDLALDLVERLGHSGVSVTLNTNGWFVDGAIADRLATVPGLRVHVSIDGATPELHDAARGVPGSWRRAVRAVSLLLDRGVTVQVVHVVTPENETAVDDFLEQMWTLGVAGIRIAGVAKVGAASDSGEWAVRERRLRRVVARFLERHEGDPAVQVVGASTAANSIRSNTPPGAILVRPLGAVLTDSLHPFAYGNARKQPLAECWQGIVENWQAPEVQRWTRGVRSARSLGRVEVVPYRDDEIPVGGLAAGAVAPHGASELAPERNAPPDIPDAEAARAGLTQLALERRYRLAPVRWSGNQDGERVVRVINSGRTCRINRTTSMAMDALADGSPAEVFHRLTQRYPQVEAGRLERDVLAAVRQLRSRGVVVPAGAVAGSAPDLTATEAAGSVSELPTAG